MAVTKAKKAAVSVKKGNQSSTKKSIRTSPKFIRPKTLRLKRQSQKKLGHVNKMDAFRVVKYPLSTESTTKQLEEENTLVFIVDPKASKKTIARSLHELYGIEVYKVNTLIRPSGDKKAYVRLTADSDALEIANKIGYLS
eukprot:NODE_101_length_19951_cov_0.932501.p13 type:complete len:140 gc:universal NODE_101_length_19951_cov_0.932501:11190-10771(-)